MYQTNNFEFKLEDVTRTFPQLMNSFFSESSHCNYFGSHPSERALQGYCWLHRTFLEFQDALHLVEISTKQVDIFLQDPKGWLPRRPQDVIAFLLFSKQTFKDVSEKLIPLIEA